MNKPLPAPERVLPTLNADGTRRRLRPRTFKGRFWQRRRVVAWMLIALFSGLPFVRIAGKPAVLLDIGAREFTLLGRTFLATDGALLMLLMLIIFIGIFLVTALLGRVWCGWSCPQTVYLEFLFRPIGRWLEGGRAAQLRLDRTGPNWRRALKFPVFLALSVVLANIFLAYFVGTERLALWISSSPLEQPTGFVVLTATTLLVFADFAFFREQMCTVVCPYARLQSVLLDPRSLIVGYDATRGEPRGRGKQAGDCVDCNACVVTCPTGIDIREGTQLECIACTQCIDACDSVMRKFKRPSGLIRYDTAHALHGTKGSIRPTRLRLFVYPTLLLMLMVALLVLGSKSQAFDVTLLRGIGAPFSLLDDTVQNQIRVKIQNRSESTGQFKLSLQGAATAQLIAPVNPVPVEAGEHLTTSVFVLAPASSFLKGQREVQLVIQQEGTRTPQLFTYTLLGPRSEAGS